MDSLWLLIYGALITIINIKVSSSQRSDFPVWFNPFVSEKDHDYSYNEKGFLPILSTIATRFSKIMAEYDDTSSRTFLPSAVANYNKLHGTPRNLPLELLPTFGFSVVEKGSNVTKFDILKQKSDQANKIYSGTVKQLYFAGYDYLNDDTVDDITTYLTYVQSQLKYTTYELGALFPISKCGTSTSLLPNYLPPVLPLVKKIFFYWYPDQQNLQEDPYTATQHIIEMFEECVQRIKTYDNHVSVGLFTGWVNFNETYNIQNDKHLVTYWKNIGDWALKSKTPVVFDRAFDNPNPNLRYQNFMYTGWWRLIENSSHSDSSQYVFEEKQKENKTEPEKDKESNNSSSLSIGYIFIGVSLLIVALLLAAIIFFRKHLCRLICKEKVSQENIVQLQEFPSAKAIIKGNASIKGLELSKSSFKIDWNSSLGKGTFGAVYLGTVKTVGRDGEREVAVKTTCPSSPSTALTDLLTEIKVLSHLGKHDNIVNIIGAYTKGVKKGKIYIFLELCELGCLEKYLRETVSRLDIQEDQAVAKDCYMEVSPDEGIHLEDAKSLQRSPSYAKDLQRWAIEIATAMEFLASKNVVHADLATRNVLLTHDMRAKVSDFGLSGRMYEYSMYVKTQQEPLPWRWMSPESLRRLEFDEKTDVWSFGVTLWEIYSLGEVPFVGLSWTPDFNSQVLDGLRLPEPSLTLDGLYSIMLKCWSIDAAKRPTFSKLKSTLQQLPIQ